VIGRRADEATPLLRSHIEASKAKSARPTLHRLYTARATSGEAWPASIRGSTAPQH